MSEDAKEFEALQNALGGGFGDDESSEEVSAPKENDETATTEVKEETPAEEVNDKAEAQEAPAKKETSADEVNDKAEAQETPAVEVNEATAEPEAKTAAPEASAPSQPAAPVAQTPTVEAPVQNTTQAKSNQNDQTLGLLVHLSGLFTMLLGPIIIWLINKDNSPYIDAEGKESVNFQLSMLIYIAAFTVITTVLSIVTFGLFAYLATLIYTGMALFFTIVIILATVETTKKGGYKYPLSIRFIK